MVNFLRENKETTALLHTVGKAYGCRPSSLIGLSSPYVSLQFDIGAVVIGTNMENEREKKEREKGAAKKYPKFSDLNEPKGNWGSLVKQMR